MARDFIFLALGGFLLGAFLFTGWYTTRFEPEVKYGYLVTGIGILISVGINTYLEFTVRRSNWFLGGTFAGYGVIALGLIMILRERRSETRDNKRSSSTKGD